MPTPGDFDVRVEETSTGRVVFHVVGELDLATVSLLEDALAAHGDARSPVIDLGGCSFLDSSGVRALAATAKRVETQGGQLELVARKDSGVARVLEITGIDTVVHVHPSLDAVL